HQRDNLEEGEVVRGSDLLVQRAGLLLGDGPAVEADALAEVAEVRRGVETRAQTRRPKRGFGESAGRALAVGARDVQRRRQQVWIAQPPQRRDHALEPQLHTEVAAGEEQLLELLEGHRARTSRKGESIWNCRPS